MNFFKVRKARKALKEILHYCRHQRNMHEDSLAPEKIAALKILETTGKKARREGDISKMSAAGDAIVVACGKIIPSKKHKKIRENVEVLFVAIAAAMGIRAYFFQPFKIPTGSMQPTLYGITLKNEPTIKASNPVVRIANFVLFGERVKTVTVKAYGRIQLEQDMYGNYRYYGQTSDTSGNNTFIYIGGIKHKIPNSMMEMVNEQARIGKVFRAGDVIASKVMKSGDYILVNRMKYNFIRPRRGDIAVFDTRELTYPQVRKDAYYIKRLVGMPGETLNILPKYLYVNGEKLNDPKFEKIFNAPNYNGYQLAMSAPQRPPLLRPEDSIMLKSDEYLFFGDNTDNSLDGRYFGAVNRRQVMGPAFFVCWPLDRAGFAETDH
ncbi:MAG: signal peptidase I [Kiritimatiellales bacterium]